MRKVKIRSVGVSLLYSFLVSALTMSVLKGFLVNVLIVPIAYFAVQRKIGIFAPQIAVAIGGLAGLFFPPVWHSVYGVILLTVALYPVGKVLATSLGMFSGKGTFLANSREEGWD